MSTDTIILIWVICGALGLAIGQNKTTGAVGGLLLGLLLGVIGIIILLLLPAKTTAPPAGWYPCPIGSGRRYWDGSAWTDHHVDP